MTPSMNVCTSQRMSLRLLSILGCQQQTETERYFLTVYSCPSQLCFRYDVWKNLPQVLAIIMLNFYTNAQVSVDLFHLKALRIRT